MISVPHDSPSLFDGKTCSTCKEWKLLTEFFRDRATPDGRHYSCKACANARTRDYLARHPGWKTDYNVRYRQTHLETITTNRHRTRPLRKAHENENNRRYLRARLYDNGTPHTPEEWEALKACYDYRCLRCHKQEPEIKLTVDHVVPISHGGSNNIANIQPLCPSCNSFKGTREFDYRE